MSTLIVDMDNTLYDWVSYFVPALAAMTSVAAEILGISERALRAELKAVHQVRGNTEHPFALLETQSVKRLSVGDDRAAAHKLLAPAFDAFDTERNARLHLYPGVSDTLATVKESGCRIIGHTDATTANIGPRLRLLKVEHLLDVVYASAFRGLPYPAATGHQHAPREPTIAHPLKKPDPRAVLTILEDIQASPKRALYVGDNRYKDIVMASSAGVMAAWASYGAVTDSTLWEQLVEVTHYQGGSVNMPASNMPLAPDVPTLHSFPEILALYRFGVEP